MDSICTISLRQIDDSSRRAKLPFGVNLEKFFQESKKENMTGVEQSRLCVSGYILEKVRSADCEMRKLVANSFATPHWISLGNKLPIQVDIHLMAIKITVRSNPIPSQWLKGYRHLDSGPAAK